MNSNPSRIGHLTSQLPSSLSNALLLTQPESQAYYLKLNFLPLSGDLYLLIVPQGYHLFYSPLFSPKIFTHPSNLRLHPLSRAFLTDLAALLPGKTSLGVEPSIPFALANRLNKLKPKPKLNLVQEIIDSPQLVKDPSERSAITSASRITSQTLTWAKSQLKPGITEIQLARAIKHHLFESGADDLAFEPIVAYGPHTASPHHVPTHKAYSSQSVALIDLGAKVTLYCSDMTRTFLPKKPDPAHQKLRQAVHDAYDRAVHSLSSATDFSQVDSAARDTISRAGFGNFFTHSTGHGLGLSIHQGPAISTGVSTPIKAHMTITIEPGIYLPGKFGYRHEDTFLTRSSKPPKNLTSQN